MRNRFDRQLEQLNNELINMGSLIEEAIEMAITALMKQDAKKAKEIVDFDEEIDEKEREIESLCLKLLLQQQPVARDLRRDIRSLKNDHRYGEDRRSCSRYFGNDNLNGRNSLYQKH